MKAVLLTLFLVACGGPAVPDPATPPAAPITVETEPQPAEAPADVEPIAEPETPAEPEVLAEPDPQPAPSPAAPSGGVADGGDCLTHQDCVNGVCQGQGCADNQPGTCQPKLRRCTRDRRPFCGCDGETFWGSSTCVNQRYLAPGECEGSGGK